jgi:decaprenyl-phosphate phosphoribosyltransferase
MLRPLVRLLRPSHWIKNAFTLAPLLFAARLSAPSALCRAASTALAFCFASSAVYALNDIVDRNRDRASPAKRHRPVASGAMSPLQASLAAGGCIATASLLCVLLVPPRAVVILGAYILLNLLYSLRLKHIVIVDVVCISSGFVMRVFAGAAAVDVPVSAWMMLTTFFLALFLGFTKRRSELVAAYGAGAREVLGEYTEPFLTILISVCAGLTVVTYGIAVTQPSVAGRSGADSLLYTVPLVVLGLLRYLYLCLQEGKGGDVAELVLGDSSLLVTVLMWAGVVVVVVALHA